MNDYVIVKLTEEVPGIGHCDDLVIGDRSAPLGAGDISIILHAGGAWVTPWRPGLPDGVAVIHIVH